MPTRREVEGEQPPHRARRDARDARDLPDARPRRHRDRGDGPGGVREPGGRGPRQQEATASPVALALAIGRAGIGLELAEPAEIGCLRVVELSTSLPGVRFPVDVSGGVARFRHRRGELRALRIEVSARTLERWMAPQLRGLVGTRTPEVWIQVGRARSTVCVSAAMNAPSEALEIPPGAERDRDDAIVAFDVHALAEGDGLVLIVSNARGAGLPEPPTATAMACLHAVLGTSASRAGAIFTLRRPARLVLLALFPSVGARLPPTQRVRWSALAADGDTWIAHAARDADAAAPTEDALRAREVAALLVEADDTLLRGDLVAARIAYTEALERAPRHAEIAARVVEIDARMPVRAEAALATLAEVSSSALGRPTGRGVGRAGTGFVTGELLSQVGDADAAIASFERAGDAEPAPSLAARAFELAGRASRDPEDAARWLDRALALAPRSVPARWRRVDARLTLGRLEDALADVEHLEALARGAHAKYAVWLRAGRGGQPRGAAAHAGPIFEHALRYAPDEPGALTGLGVALLGEGREARGVSLLDRALEIVRSRGGAESSVRLALATALAERLDDLPTAIAHASAIPATAPEAGGLGGRWRARLGDLAGATLAFARLRDAAASLTPAARVGDPEAHAIVRLLLEAATMERDVRDDSLAAQRHLAVALRLLPHDVEARRAYREVGS